MKLEDLIELPAPIAAAPLKEEDDTLEEGKGNAENKTFHKAPPPTERLITVAQAAKLQHVSPSRIRQKIMKKKLHAKAPVEGRRDSLLDRREVLRDRAKPAKKTGRPKGS